MNIVFFGSSSFVVPIIEDIQDNIGKTLIDVLKARIELILDKVTLTFPVQQELTELPSIISQYSWANSPINLLGVVSQPNHNNHGKVTVNPVTLHAKATGLKLFQPDRVNTVVEELHKFFGNFDIGVVASFGQIISMELINMPRFRMINWHPSLLPLYRGATPIQTAIANGENQIGLSWIQMVKGMDAGNILFQTQKKTSESDDFSYISSVMGLEGAWTWPFAVAIQALERSDHNKSVSLPQNETQATFTKLVSKNDRLVDFRTLSSLQIYNRWRGFKQFPGVTIQDLDYFQTECRLDEIEYEVEFSSLDKILGNEMDNTVIHKSINWIQIRSQNRLKTYLICNNHSILEVKRITIQTTGKRIDFKGFGFNLTTTKV